MKLNMNNTNVVIFIKGKDVQKFFPTESERTCWRILRTIKDSKKKNKVTAEDFIEYCNEEYNLNLNKEKIMEVMKIKN